ncbi:MAG: DMT family transporter [Acetobacteraceae bacterium]|nr:DMT family transporter [Acetobacteraceae bacterium]
MSPAVKGLLLAAGAGFTFSVLNALLRVLATELPPFQVQFLRYGFGLLVMLPFLGVAALRPRALGGQLWRGVIHTAALICWFIALPNIPFADVTAIGFTGPICIMLGAALFLGERMIWQRWAAAGLGLAGVLIVVGPNLGGTGGVYYLWMALATPLFAASFLITKALTRRDTPEVIVAWQSLTVTLFSLPLALWDWAPLSLAQWGLAVLCGALGSFGHVLLTHAYKIADISAAQGVKFLDLVWAALLGWLVFAEVPTGFTIAGALVIFAATTWITRAEARGFGNRT